MTNQEFYKEVEQNIMAYMPEIFTDKEQVNVTEIVKNNDLKLHGLTIKKENEEMAPNVYLEDFYNDFQEGRPMNEIMQNIADMYMNAYSSVDRNTIAKPDISLKYEDVKEKLTVQVLDMKRNKEKLKTMAFTPIGNDLAMTYAYVVSSDELGEAKIGITRAIVQEYGYNLTELNKDALENSVKTYPAILSDMEKVMEAMMGGSPSEPPLLNDELKVDKDTQMLVLSNVNGLQGAATLFYPGVQEQIAKAIDDSYFVLPSSIHEVLIVPEKTGHTARDLENMVKEANATQVAPEEVLSDKVLRYDRDSKELSFANRDAREKGSQEREER